MKDISLLFAAELSKKLPEPETGDDLLSKRKGACVQMPLLRENVVQPSSIMQLNAIPKLIDVNNYKNPHTAENPNGDYKAAYRFSVLSDAIPKLMPYFEDSLNSTKKIWGNIVNLATPKTKYAEAVISAAKLMFKTSKLSGMGGIPEDWYPVYARPFNWYDLVLDSTNLARIEIDTRGGDTKSGFLIIDGDHSVSWNIVDKNEQMVSNISLNQNTEIKKIYMDILRVDIVRPWLDFEVFSTDWQIDGLKRAYYSNGCVDGNTGVFPLITESILIGAKINIEGEFAPEDMRILSEHRNNGSELSIGPFLINTRLQPMDVEAKGKILSIHSETKQIVGYISKLIPVAPQYS